MDLATLITQVASQSKYPVIFLLCFVDANTTNFISSGIAATGVLNIWIIWAGAILVELIVDIFYYYLGGKLSEKQIASRINKRKNENKIISTLDEAYRKRPGITLMIVKLLGPLAIPSIMYMGKVKVLNIWKFLQYGMIVAVTRGTLITILGYLVGKGLSQFTELYNLLKALGLILIFSIIIYVIYKAYQDRIEEWALNIFKKLK